MLSPSPSQPIPTPTLLHGFYCELHRMCISCPHDRNKKQECSYNKHHIVLLHIHSFQMFGSFTSIACVPCVFCILRSVCVVCMRQLCCCVAYCFRCVQRECVDPLIIWSYQSDTPEYNSQPSPHTDDDTTRQKPRTALSAFAFVHSINSSFSVSSHTSRFVPFRCVRYTHTRQQQSHPHTHPHSMPAEVRQEAVQQALAALKNRPKPSLPMPSKRSSVLNRSPERDHDDSGR